MPTIFLVWSRESSVPLTIFAPSGSEAFITYQEWVAIHSPGWSRDPALIEEVSYHWLAERPQLAEAVARAIETKMHDAVLLFVNHVAGWLAVPTHAARIGAIAPPEPLVRCYEVRVEKEGLEGVEVMVFAHDPEHTLRLYCEWHETFFGAIDHPYEIREFSRWTLTGDQTVLRDQMDTGCVGIAGWSPTRGWSIYPPDHEMAGE